MVKHDSICFKHTFFFFIFKEKGLEKSPLSEHFLIKTRKISPPPQHATKKQKPKN